MTINQQPSIDHEHYMKLAIEQALKAQDIGEVPVGAIVVDNQGEVIGKGFNQCITMHDPSLHAEMVAVREACKRVNNYRLVNTSLYVTLEPCSMCAGLLVHSRIKNLIFAATDLKTGAAGSVINLVQHDMLNHKVNVIDGVLSNECSGMLSTFFAMRRDEKKKLKALKKAAN